MPCLGNLSCLPYVSFDPKEELRRTQQIDSILMPKQDVDYLIKKVKFASHVLEHRLYIQLVFDTFRSNVHLIHKH